MVQILYFRKHLASNFQHQVSNIHSCTIYLCQFRHEECEIENDKINESIEIKEKDSNFGSCPFTFTPKKQELKCEN